MHQTIDFTYGSCGELYLRIEWYGPHCGVKCRVVRKLLVGAMLRHSMASSLVLVVLLCMDPGNAGTCFGCHERYLLGQLAVTQ